MTEIDIADAIKRLRKLAMPVWDSDLGIERKTPCVREEAIAEEMAAW